LPLLLRSKNRPAASCPILMRLANGAALMNTKSTAVVAIEQLIQIDG
jgi:hypothetical protein